MDKQKIDEQLEASDSQYHAAVTRLQVNAQSLKHEIEEDNYLERERYIESHLNETIYDITEKFDKIMHIDIEKVRGETALLIAKEMDNRAERNRQIQHYADNF